MPETLAWEAPAGYWRRDFRIPEWLPAPVTPSFATWVLPSLDLGFADALIADFGMSFVPPCTTVVNGWCFSRDPKPKGAGKAFLRSPGRMLKMGPAVMGWPKDPARYERTIAQPALDRYRAVEWPAHQAKVAAAEARVADEDPAGLVATIDELTHSTGTLMLAMVQSLGFAGKAEFVLARFYREHLLDTLGGSYLPLVSGLLTETDLPPHAVSSLDWIEPTVGELDATSAALPAEPARRREEAETAARAALDDGERARFDELLAIAQRWIPIRHELALDFTLAWPTLRLALGRLGAELAGRSVLAEADDVYFLTRDEVAGGIGADTAARRAEREAQRSLDVPLALGKPTGPWRKLDEFTSVLRGEDAPASPPLLLGLPASTGRATGVVQVVNGPEDFADFEPGAVLVAAATAPAWTPLFATAAAVVTDSGSTFAHAAVVAREYGIPAVVATGSATARLATGDRVVVDGDRGTVVLA